MPQSPESGDFVELGERLKQLARTVDDLPFLGSNPDRRLLDLRSYLDFMRLPQIEQDIGVHGDQRG
jgi:hypothetical protein